MVSIREESFFFFEKKAAVQQYVWHVHVTEYSHCPAVFFSFTPYPISLSLFSMVLFIPDRQNLIFFPFRLSRRLQPPGYPLYSYRYRNRPFT